MPAEFAPAIPEDWAASLEATFPTITEKMSDTAVVGDDWISNLSRLGTALVMTVQQRQILSVQMDRARAGLPPLNVSEYAPQVNVGLDANTQNMLMWGGAALLGFTLLNSAGRR